MGLPKLDQSIQQIKDLLPKIRQPTIDATHAVASPGQASDFYMAIMALLCYLKTDCALLHSIREENGASGGDPCPPPDQIPAITAVVHDHKLFQALLNCLLTSAEQVPSLDGAHMNNNSNNNNNNNHRFAERNASLTTTTVPGGRKRLMSGDDTVNNHHHPHHNNKSMKLSQSPGPGNRHQKQQQVDLKNRRKAPQPSMSLQVLASTIIYAAFQHLDHWPAPLVKAYAEDSFGSRSWVEDARCQLLVQNLALVHRNPAMPSKLKGTDNKSGSQNHNATFAKDGKGIDDPLQVADALKLAEAYRKFESRATKKQPDVSKSHPLPPSQTTSALSSTSAVRRRPSLSSSAPGSSGIKRPRSISVDSMQSAKHTQKFRATSAPLAADAIAGNGVRRANPKDTSKADGRTDADMKEKDDDSSSGEEDEDVEPMTSGHTKMNNSNREDKSRATETAWVVSVDSAYPLAPVTMNLERVRNRFVWANREYAHECIALCLGDRLNLRSKQNSGLLQSLPSFATIPGVRRLIAENLEKWLQSPALAGLARTLFSTTVKHLTIVDPPLDDDLRTIDCIVGMKLKANQLNAHIENITGIARRLPSASVVNHIYAKLFREVLATTESTVLSPTNQFKMISAIHGAVSSQTSYDAIAAALLTMLAHPVVASNAATAQPRADRDKLVRRLRNIIRGVASEFGPSFDGSSLIGALLSFDVHSESWSSRDEEDKARLMYQCASLSVAAVVRERDNKPITTSREATLRRDLMAIRRQCLTWCCMDYGPLFSAQVRRKRSVPVSSGREEDSTLEIRPPDFSSALNSSIEERIPLWLNTMRCLLFMEEAESPLTRRFVFPGGVSEDEEAEWKEECVRINICTSYGSDLNSDMIWIVLKSASLPRGGIECEMGIQLLEHLFECCSTTRSGTLHANDSMIIWELYNLVRYHPEKPINTIASSSDCIKNNTDECAPRLAYAGLWWRVTLLALVMCAAATEDVALVAWNEHPTLRALMKMVTSHRYRFPTVDTDEHERDEMKRAEQSARDEETRIAELLFLPRIQESKKITKKTGSRVSRRLLKQQQEKEAAEEVAERNRRKKLLRSAQKSIMLWDPTGPARKPPKESADLLISVEKLFRLGDTFQCAVGPDILLLTIGRTTRASIERAYDWLIPIISRLPNTIARLPSSASCFLLLRAYGTEGEERAQLKQLSAPLLRHVKDSLNGNFGESDAVKALDLLMSDLASYNRDRRRYARRVLRDALADHEELDATATSWMTSILHLSHAASLVSVAVKHMSVAATFERGETLRSLVIAVEQHIAFAERSGVGVDCSFASLLLRLISDRPSVYAEAMDNFSNLRLLAIRVVHSEFAERAKADTTPKEQDRAGFAVVHLNPTPLFGAGSANLPVTLLKATSVVLSIWKDFYGKDATEAASAVDDLLCALTSDGGDNTTAATDRDGVGLAGAKLDDGSSLAVSVESWIMLAKARSDLIARRAALSAPLGFLPRLLLCSALPRTSFSTMLDRLGRLGDSVEDKDAVFTPLLAPSASSVWDIGRVGQRREMCRKLLGRLNAYARLNRRHDHPDVEVCTTFVDWLSQESRRQEEKWEKAKKKGKKAKPVQSQMLRNTASVSDVLLDQFAEVEQVAMPLTLPPVADAQLIEFMSLR